MIVRAIKAHYGPEHGGSGFWRRRGQGAAATPLYGYVDPNGNGTNIEWTPIGSYHYQAVDDAVRQPTAPTEGTDEAVRTGGVLGVREEYNYTTLTVGSVFGIWPWVYFKKATGGDTTANIQIYMGGAWQTAQTIAILGGGVGVWYSKEFLGTWTQADLNALQTRLVTVNTDNFFFSGIYCYVGYYA